MSDRERLGTLISFAPAEGRSEASPLRMLTEEEIRALLTPIEAVGDGTSRPVLLLSEQPQETAGLAAWFRAKGVASVVAANCYVALDLFRVRPYAAVVLSFGALPGNPTGYLERIRRVDPDIPLFVIHDRGQEVPDLGGTAMGRPLDDALLARTLGRLGPDGPAERRRKQDLPLAEAPSRERDTGFPADPPPAGSANPSRPDPMAAVKALLESRVAGRELHQGLYRWAEADPSIEGIVEVREGSRESSVLAQGGDRAGRRNMVLLLLQQLERAPADPAEPSSLGPFSLFPVRAPGGPLVAVLHRDEAQGREALDHLRPLLPLIELLPARVGADAAAARQRFVALLESRMGAAQRIDGRLGILLLEGGSRDGAAEIAATLRNVLRGGDWVETVGERVYVILEQPEQEVFAALGVRLRALPDVDRLQVVALGWKRSEGEALHLVERAERILETGGRGEPLPGLSD